MSSDTRVPMQDVVDGGVYAMRWRSCLGVGIALPGDTPCRVYAGMRSKFGFLSAFVEHDWDCGEPFGTATPLQMLGVCDLTDKPTLREGWDWMEQRLREWNDRFPTEAWANTKEGL